MKITSKEIKLITEAIVDQVFDENKFNKQVDDELEKAWNEFAKSKQRKDTVKLLKLGKLLDGFEGISVKDREFFGLKTMCGSCTYKITSEAKAKETYCNWKRSSITNKLPQRYMITRKVETLLTIKTLCGDDMETIMNDIISAVKKEFKL